MASSLPEFTEVEPELYDALIDWPKRLSNETPLLRELVARTGARRVLDAACGTGRHAALLHSWGLDVVGADAGPAMIAHCRQVHGDAPGLTWIERPFNQRPTAHDGQRFDVVVCLGNSLALNGSEREVKESVSAMIDWLRPGGALLVQVLNLRAIPEGETLWQKCLQTSLRGQPHILLKGIHRTADHGYVDLVDLTLDLGGVQPRYHQASFLDVQADWLTTAARQTNAAIELFGSYAKKPFAPEDSTDLIAIVQN